MTNVELPLNNEEWNCKNCKFCKTNFDNRIFFCDEYKKEIELNEACINWIKADEGYLPNFVKQELNEIDKKVLLNQILICLKTKDRSQASEILVNEVKKKYRIYTIRKDIENPEMWVYYDGIYIPEARTFVRAFCRNIMGDTFTNQLVNEVIKKIEVDTYIDENKFFEYNDNINEIAIKNGILNIYSRELRPFSPEDKFFNKINVNYNPVAECPNILKHLKTVLKNEEDKDIFLEICGWCLLREYRPEKIIVWTGRGRNGKTKTAELLKLFLGPDTCANIPPQRLETEPFATAELLHKLANIAGDVSAEALKTTGQIKMLSGGDFVSANRKFLPMIHFKNYAKMIFLMNEIPRTYDLSDAFFGRLIIQEFPYEFISEKEIRQRKSEDISNCKIKDEKIVEKLTSEEELSGLLNLALISLVKIQDLRDFSYSKTTQEVKDMWLRKSDSFNAFFMDILELQPESKITKQELRKVYANYCHKHKLKPQGDRTINESLTRQGVSEDDELIESKKVRLWWGINFKFGKSKIDERGYSWFINENNNNILSIKVDEEDLSWFGEN
jgi:putative DNA primase/helicase